MHNEGGGAFFANLGFTFGVILSYLERHFVFCGPANFITRADNLLRVRMNY